MKLTLPLLFIYLVSFGPATAQELPYVSDSNSWNPDSLGNVRAVIDVKQKGAAAARARIDWRRRDRHTDSEVIVVDSSTNRRVLNVKTDHISRESGEVTFEPESGAGTYYIYYLPYKVQGRTNYPTANYLKRSNTASATWLSSLKNAIPAKVRHIEAVNGMSSPYPMEVIAKSGEIKKLLAANASRKYLVFPEDRMHPIRMTDDLPQRWIKKGANRAFHDEAQPGENYTFQLGVYPTSLSLNNVRIRFSDLKQGSLAIIPAKAFSCLNTDGTGWDAQPVKKQVSVAKGKVQALWCLADIPANIPAGAYTGKVYVTASNAPETAIDIALQIGGPVLSDKGISDPQKQTRLAWLNSTMAQQNDVISPYLPLQRQGNTISLLGRRFTVGSNGLPERIETYFTPEMTGLSTTPKDVLKAPFRFVVTAKGGSVEKWADQGVRYTEQSPGTVAWTAAGTSSHLRMDVTGHIEFDGFVAYDVQVTALSDTELDDIYMDIPMSPDAARYMMGLNLKGGKRPASYDWKWEVATKNQDGAWIGDVNAGLNFSLRDEHYVRPLNTNFYLQKPLLLPTSWGNANKGGIRISETDGQVLVRNYSSARTMKKGERLHYNFTLLITPFHALDTDAQWKTRFYHRYNDPDSIRAKGATIVNIHHATPINPYINYPFIEHKAMKAYIDKAHRDGLQVKIYNTVRELSNSAYELFPLRSLGHEIFSPGKGLGYAWLQEHLGDDYIAAWYVPEIKDAAVVNSGMSRWHNYYVEGMNWLTQNVGIDGIYLDDVAFDRTTMKRVKRVLTRDGHPGYIDLHSANQYNKNDGFNNSANLYMEHFPYLNRLWFGEYFDYEQNNPDFFMTEVSGIPFGLMGEMLENGGNPWRGLIYGMTNRMPWKEGSDARAIWKVWDAFGMQGSKMLGYWTDANPVKTDHAKVLTTSYVQDKRALVSIASWAEADTSFHLNIDWKKLGIDPHKAQITAPEIVNFQSAANFTAAQSIPVTKGRGWLLIISEKP
ncbi:glycoside hydrolase domain-containing protein [Dyadobacter sp. BHUBP1]|uniref:glycoside hydrolase domain-containing protein n=1 Tax=Dyadobacter sp. BHUBP1 TaxID=3424178 RepID=UPI003D349C67